ncbi:MAG: hypothetical protein LBU90_07725 [Bacteroidales bacterium]|jgi:lysophospholipase L1-like esterase|nr:hypothetical protein [Bacteroidales bacterium]
MHKNYIRTVFFFLVTVVAVVWRFHSLSIAPTIKPYNLLADVSIKETPKLLDSVAVAPTIAVVPPPPPRDSFPYPKGVLRLENFTGNEYPLDSLIEKLFTNEQVRAAWFGDSFTEADILVGDLRDTLQSLYGGNGVGFVPMATDAAGYRRTVAHNHSGWNTQSFINKKAGDINFGICGRIYEPSAAAYSTYKSSNSHRHTRKFDKIRVFYTAQTNRNFLMRVGSEEWQSLPLTATKLPQQVVVNNGNTQTVSLRMNDTIGGISFYGASLEDTTGFYIDNFSIKSNSGLGMLHLREDFLHSFHEMLHYDLIVLQFGLNVAGKTPMNYSNYTKQMEKVIEKLKQSFPDVPILIISVSDRSHQVQGEYKTMEGIPYFVEVQRKMAADNHLLFWNLYEAMGGENSMANFVEKNLANKDYTHLNHAGGRVLGLKLANTFIHEVDVYKKRKSQQYPHQEINPQTPHFADIVPHTSIKTELHK